MNELEEYQEGLLWKLMDGDSIVIGVTQGALDLSGTVQSVELCDLEDEFEEGDWIGEIRGKNSLVEIVAPCALRVLERNDELLDQPGMIEDDPTGDAWVLRAEKLNG